MPKYYIIQATAGTADKHGNGRSRQVPTFYLDAEALGIVSVSHAKRVAARIIGNPIGISAELLCPQAGIS